jgi:cyclopropane fatty-acyl-phospholipid synthase-like methyltransferase
MSALGDGMSALADDCCGYAARTDWPADVSRLPFEHLARVGFDGRTVLEVGCGYGRLLVGALVEGARSATGIELDADAVGKAAARAERAGVADRCSVILADGAEADLAAHDIVVLDRVICCYDDADRLVDRTVSAAGLAYAFSVPESRGLRGMRNRVAYAIEGVYDALRGNARSYAHDVRRIDRRLRVAGFQLGTSGRQGKWYLAVYLRPG